jgi:hypothetical protein
MAASERSALATMLVRIAAAAPQCSRRRKWGCERLI